MALSAIDQKEYLKRYLSGDDSKPKKKRKKKHPVAKRTMVIVDDDVDINTLGPSEETVQKVEEELFDDAPTVAGIVDERPAVEQRIEEYRKSDKWKGLKDHREERSKGPADRLQTSDHKKQRHDSDSDLSPVRSKNFKRSSDDLSPVRSKNRHDSDSDLSPVRSKTRHDSDSDLSPARNMKNQDSDRNTSHKRSANRSDSDDDLSPVRSRTRHDSDGDLSPVRSKKRHDSDSDLSPVRSKQKHNSDSDLSPPRPNKRHDSDSDLSPVRTSSKRDPDGDLSPDRSKKHRSGYVMNSKDGKGGKTSRKQKEGKGHGGSDSDLSPERKKLDQSGKLKKTLSGHKAGLQDAQTLKKENEANRRRQDRLFEAMGDEALGKNSATVFRDKTGKKRDLAKEKAKEEEEAAKKAKENAKFQEWGKGMAQKEKQQQMVLDAAKEMTKPLARYENDQDLDSFLKEQEREGDPMLAMIRKKKNKERELTGIKEKPKYKGPAPQPNRFGIQPGYRWDGVDRSNGFEKKYFARMANNKAMQEVKYKWSVEDM